MSSIPHLPRASIASSPSSAPWAPPSPSAARATGPARAAVDCVIPSTPVANGDAPSVLQALENVVERLKTLESGAQAQQRALGEVQALAKSLETKLAAAARDLRAQPLSRPREWTSLDETARRVFEDLSIELQRAAAAGQKVIRLTSPWLKMEVRARTQTRLDDLDGVQLSNLGRSGFHNGYDRQFASVWAGYSAFVGAAAGSGFAVESASLSDWSIKTTYGPGTAGKSRCVPQELTVTFRQV